MAGLLLLLIVLVLLISPGAYHRLVTEGEDTNGVHRFTSTAIFLLSAMVTLALGVCGDLFVVLRMVSASTWLAAGFSIGMLLFFYGVWSDLSIFLRNKRPLE